MTRIARKASATVESEGIGATAKGPSTVIDAIASLPGPPLSEVTVSVVLS